MRSASVAPLFPHAGFKNKPCGLDCKTSPKIEACRSGRFTECKAASAFGATWYFHAVALVRWPCRLVSIHKQTRQSQSQLRICKRTLIGCGIRVIGLFHPMLRTQTLHLPGIFESQYIVRAHMARSSCLFVRSANLVSAVCKLPPPLNDRPFARRTKEFLIRPENRSC